MRRPLRKSQPKDLGLFEDDSVPSIGQETQSTPSQIGSNTLQVGTSWREDPGPIYHDDEFDNVDYILDPTTYYARLDDLEEKIVRGSEFYRQKHDDGSWDIKRNDHSALELPLECNDILFRSARHADVTGYLSHNSFSAGYVIISNVLRLFDALVNHNFCSNYYSILVEVDEEGETAELIKIERQAIVAFHDLLANAILQSEGVESRSLKVACLSFLLSLKLYLPSSGEVDRLHDRLDEGLLVKHVAYLLDLGLVTYVRSHGCRFDLDYFGEDMSPICLEYSYTDGRSGGFRCTLQHLSCLSGFLDQGMVWVFSRMNQLPESKVSQRRQYAVLTHIAEFADVWGPVWEIPIGDRSPDNIRQYNISKGSIVAISQELDATYNATKCHWIQTTDTRASRDPIGTLQTYIRRNTKLLIGSPDHGYIRPDPHCMYTIDHFERDMGNTFMTLGTRDSYWEWDERQVGVSASQYVGFNVLGTQKKLPHTTLKQHIWDQISNRPTTLNPSIFNQMLRVEISHCTGNAKRIALKNLFPMEPIQEAFEACIPGWATADYGSAFMEALQSPDGRSLTRLWKDVAKYRPYIARMLRYVLGLLETTGIQGNQTFQAAFVNHDREFNVPLKTNENGWTGLLKDCHLTAVYAIINSSCLQCTCRKCKARGSKSYHAMCSSHRQAALHSVRDPHSMRTRPEY